MTGLKRYYYEDGNGHYVIEPNATQEKFRFVWMEVALEQEYIEPGKWRDSRIEALRDAADDWDASGLGGRLASTLRGAATRIENSEKAAVK